MSLCCLKGEKNGGSQNTYAKRDQGSQKCHANLNVWVISSPHNKGYEYINKLFPAKGNISNNHDVIRGYFRFTFCPGNSIVPAFYVASVRCFQI